MQVIPFLSAKQENETPGYRRFENASRYITALSEKIPLSNELMGDSGYGNLNKFRIHRVQFDQMLRNVPLDYLRAIGAERDQLKVCLARDMEAFIEYRETGRVITRSATIMLASFLYRKLPFPENCPEEEGVELARCHSLETGQSLFINYPGFKIIWVYQGGRVVTTYRPPAYRFTQAHLSIGNKGFYGNKQGQVYLR